MKLKCFLICFLLLVYGFSFVQQEKYRQFALPHLSFPFPATAQKVALGFLRQLSAEIRFIQTAVFLGDSRVIKLSNTYIERLSLGFNVMADLHPAFIDTYFLCQSTLPHLGAEEARTTNMVLQRGIDALPNNYMLPFFKGFNHFYYLNEKMQGAKALYNASQKPGSPTWLAHLSSMLSAESGDIYAGLIWLKAIRAAEEDEVLRAKYDRDITMFENALTVQKAIWAYRKRNGTYPEDLEALVPEFIPTLPHFDGKFSLDWKPPVLQLKRASRISPAG